MTVGLVVLLVAAFLVGWVSPGLQHQANLGFFTVDAAQKPWTLVTYPFSAGANDLLSLVFACLWLWGIGGQVERDMRSKRYLGAWLVFSILCAAGVWAGSAILGTHAMLFGAWNPIAAITVIWGVRNPGATIQIFFVLPITGKWLAWLSAGLVFFGTRPPELAPFGAAALAFAYLFAADRLPFAGYFGARRGMTRGENAAGTRKVYRPEYYDEVKRREQVRKEKERLRRLFEKSMIDDPDDK